MPQVIGAILAFILMIWAVTIVVWLIQWAVAAIVWAFQAVLLPVFIFLLPAIIALVVLAGLYWGSWIAARNYFHSVRMNVSPEGALKMIVRRSVVSFQTVMMVLLCAVSTAVSGFAIYDLSLVGWERVRGYYAGIEFPLYEILYPFWEHF